VIVDAAAVITQVDRTWATQILPALHDYIAIPNVSAAFDSYWAAHGHMGRAVDLVADWCRQRPIAGLVVDVHQLPGRTPVVVCEVPASGGEGTVLLYGHLDKQPEMSGWRSGLGPWTPVLDGDRLYGRGGADDGYAAFASLAAIEAVQTAGGAHARCVVLIEASEESGSPDLPAHVDALAGRIGQPDLVVCLDSGALDYDRLWLTTSLRGLASVTLTVEVLDEGVHSGLAGGIVPCSFRVARALLARLEDERTGAIRISDAWVAVPPDRLAEAADTAAVAGSLAAELPMVAGSRPTSDDPLDQLLARTWRPTLAVTGAEGLPPISRAGNVLRPSTALQLSVRLPPTCDAQRAAEAMAHVLGADPPYGARVTLTGREATTGWNAPPFAPWLSACLERASEDCFGAPARAVGEGGTIPFMGMLGARFPDAQFLVTGVLGPKSNAHGPNEFLDVPTARRLTACIAIVLDDHARR
jgi:acetylornithine deacetylase/succinyl-diaminopimelate desuccinylase-like protein